MNVNGTHTTVRPGSRFLAEHLRDDLGLTSVKIACDRVECGSCTVLHGDDPVASCRFPVALVREPVSTLEGIAADTCLDPIDLRLANQRPAYEPAHCGYNVLTAALDQCLSEARQASGWDDHRRASAPGVGMGVAVGVYGSGSYAYEHANRADAAIDIAADGRVTLRFGGADAGTGQRTILAQIVAEELGLNVSDVAILSMDSEHTPFEMVAWSSRGTQMTGHAVHLTALEARRTLTALAVNLLGTEHVKFGGGSVMSDAGTATFAELVATSCQLRDGTLTIEASFVDDSIEMMSPDKNAANLSPSYVFAAHVVKVHVDERTGRLRLLDYVAAHDLGRAINPLLAEGQIIGGAAMGIGGARGEELLFEHGRVVNGAYINYPLPRAADVCDIRPIIVDNSEPAGPYGAKSVGEMSLIPTAPAIANAVADAVGIRVRDMPITPDKIVTAVAQRDGRRRTLRLWRRPSTWWIGAMRWLYPRGLHRALEIAGERLQPDRTQPYEMGEITSPATVDAAVAALADGARPIGGGTDVVVRSHQGLGTSTALVAARAIDGLAAIDLTGAQWRLGAAATLAAVADAVRQPAPGLADCIDTIATPQIRAVATVAGNLLQEKRCWFYRNRFSCYKRAGALHQCYAVLGDHRFYHAAANGHRCQATTPSDLATALFALDATVTLVGAEPRRTLTIDDLYTGPGETDVQPDELLTQVTLPAVTPNDRFGFDKVRLCDGDFATVSVAVALRPGDVRVVLGGLAPTPIRLQQLERQLAGGALEPPDWRQAADAALDRIAHPLAGNAWKLDAASGLIVGLLETLTPPTDTAFRKD